MKSKDDRTNETIVAQKRREEERGVQLFVQRLVVFYLHQQRFELGRVVDQVADHHLLVLQVTHRLTYKPIKSNVSAAFKFFNGSKNKFCIIRCHKQHLGF